MNTHTHMAPPLSLFLSDFYLIETQLIKCIFLCTIAKRFHRPSATVRICYRQLTLKLVIFLSRAPEKLLILLSVSHRVHCSELKMPPSFFSLLRDLCTFQHAAAINSMTNPETSSTRDTTLVWGSVLKVNVTPVPAMPITSEMTPKGNTQRYQDSSVPPVAWARRSSVDRPSGALGTAIGGVPSRARLHSGSSVASCAEAGGWQGKRPDEQPIPLAF